MLDAAKKELELNGPAAAVAFLQSHDDGEPLVSAYEDLLMHAYWERKDTAAVVLIAVAGIACCLRRADRLRAGSPQAAAHTLRSAQAMSYNMASFCWTGWDEPGITISPTQQQAGLSAARQSLGLVKQLELGDLALARGHWIVGVHHVARGDHADAHAALTASEAHAAKVPSPADVLLARGFDQLARLLDRREDPAALEQQLGQTKQELLPLEDGKEFVRQIETAERLWRHGAAVS